MSTSGLSCAWPGTPSPAATTCLCLATMHAAATDSKHGQADAGFFSRREFCFTMDGDIFVRYQSFRVCAMLRLLKADALICLPCDVSNLHFPVCAVHDRMGQTWQTASRASAPPRLISGPCTPATLKTAKSLNVGRAIPHPFCVCCKDTAAALPAWMAPSSMFLKTNMMRFATTV